MRINNVKPIITIAIPFFNAEEYLESSIESVLWQSCSEWKLLLIDDGSTDNSLNIAKKYADSDERIVVYSDGENRNLGFRLNQIPTLVDTEYLARMDADDIMHPLRIEKQLQILKNNSTIDVLGTNAYTIDENSVVFGIRVNPSNMPSIYKVNHFIHPTIMAKTEWFIKNPYDVTAVRIEDAELWYRTNHMNNFMMTNVPLLFYREFSGEYYKKYRKVIPSLFKIVKKYKSIFWYRVLIFSIINVVVYFIFEKLLKSDYLLKRRSKVLFSKKHKIAEFI